MTDSNRVHVTFVLDASGSMAAVKRATIEGFNSYLLSLKELQEQQNKTITALFYKFSNKVKKLHDIAKPVDIITGLTNVNYQTIGSTAYLDALGTAITETGEYLSSLSEHERPGKVLFVAISDGEENASRNYSESEVNAMIRLQQNTYSWEFVYLGASEILVDNARRAGINSVRKFNQTDSGVTESFNRLRGATVSYVASANYTPGSFFDGSIDYDVPKVSAKVESKRDWLQQHMDKKRLKNV